MSGKGLLLVQSWLRLDQIVHAKTANSSGFLQFSITKLANGLPVMSYFKTTIFIILFFYNYFM